MCSLPNALKLNPQQYVPAQTLRPSSNFKLSVARVSGTFQDITLNVFSQGRHNIRICKGNCEFNRKGKFQLQMLTVLPV